MRHPSGSTIGRAIQCPAAFILPAVRDGNPSPYAERGTAIHLFLETAAAEGREAALAHMSPEWRPVCEAIDTSRLPLDKASWSHEMGFIWDAESDTAVGLGPVQNREYGDLGPGRLPMTVDVLGLTPDAAVVGDYKSGRHASLWQLKAAALAVCRTYKRKRAIAWFCWIGEDGESEFSLYEWDAFDLDDFAQAILGAFAALHEADRLYQLGKQPDVQTGPECSYCEAYLRCPAKVGLLQEITADPMAIERRVAGGLFPDVAPEAYDRFRQAEEVLKRVREQLYAYGKENPIALGNGRVFGPKETSTERVVDAQGVYELMATMYGAEVAEAACSRDTSKAAIERALKPYAAQEGRPVAEVMREILDVARREGSVKTTTSVSVKEYSTEPRKRAAKGQAA